MSRGGGETLRSIQDTVRSLLGVAIDAFSNEVKNREVNVSTLSRRMRPMPQEAELDVDNFLVEVNGSGIREALRLVLDLEFEKPEILLVEEPEVHLHPALEIAMMRHLKTVSAETQVFLTTHSTNFLDTGDMQNVYMIRKTSSTSISHLDVTTAENELPKELGIRLSSIFMFDRLVFVEGASDELVLRAFAETLGFNFSQANVGFVVMGSARNFTHYASNATMSLLSRRQVRSTFVLDRDEQSDTSIDRLMDQLGEDGHLHVLTKREIENYLVHEDAIAELLVRRLRQSNASLCSGVSAGRVRELILDKANG
ncbi:MAG: AAA family ATPase, partial [Acidobacteria bacterium]|nr:AAA family ATPase [Acidobacteriota bacterium]